MSVWYVNGKEIKQLLDPERENTPVML